MFTPEQTEHLNAPLSKAHVKERSQAGRTLSYVEAWWAIAEANRIFGFDAWNRETMELRQLGEPRLVGDKFRVGYMAKVRVTVGAVIREGCGFGSGIDKDPDQAHESALKEAESDAMKRALMTFGNPFGLALYDKTQANVVDDSEPPPPKKSAYAAKKEGLGPRADELIHELRSTIDEVELTQWAKDHADEIGKLPDGWQSMIREEFTEQRMRLRGSDMDEAFRGAVGPAGSDSVSRRNGHVEAA